MGWQTHGHEHSETVAYDNSIGLSGLPLLLVTTTITVQNHKTTTLMVH